MKSEKGKVKRGEKGKSQIREMKYVKLAIISVIAFSVLLLLMSLLFPSHVRISRAINIQAASANIRPLLADTSNWKSWMTIQTDKLNVTPGDSDASLLSSRWNYGGRSIESTFRLEESAGITVIQWYFDFHLRWYPWEKFGSITFDKQFGTSMESSLNNLKKLIENSP